MTVTIKRAHEEPSTEDGYRVLVDRLWPRGISKDRAHLDQWLKDVAPSTELRRWFHADEGSFDEFAARYRDELTTNPAVDQLRDILAAHPVVTLVYAAKTPHDRSHAAVLAAYLGLTPSV
ncbi:DUF488 family protein [Couchioplanes caeruleus]|uniref:DUF488 domain-containing protein n=1 Tax=Couchioplanes caeruleus TaxID=56438 RepID=UPI0020BFB33A|nr:DUF488 family protein [Couchioplanes caeruleus]UQU66593.1 DUF488 family protein [Couchioplanes caeruleus]